MIARRALATVFVVAGVTGLVGCTTHVEAETDDASGSTAAAEVTTTGSAPITFAFVCRDGDAAPTTYTTYAAVWKADRTDCRADRITGTEMSAQQRDAVRATEGRASLGELAATCAERGVGPWRSAVETDAQADLAAGLVEYCPGHPDRDRLHEALAAYRG